MKPRHLRTLLLSVFAGLALSAGCTHDCTPENCPTGCCDPDGVCFVGSTDEYCGLEAASCQDCASSGLICSEEGTCVEPCRSRGIACEVSADENQCCGTLVCFEGKCDSCRYVDMSCDKTEQCCPGLRCVPGNVCVR